MWRRSSVYEQNVCVAAAMFMGAMKKSETDTPRVTVMQQVGHSNKPNSKAATRFVLEALFDRPAVVSLSLRLYEISWKIDTT